MGILSLILGILSILLSPLGVVFGSLGILFSAVDRKKYSSGGINTAGLITSTIGLILGLVFFVLFIVGVSSSLFIIK